MKTNFVIELSSINGNILKVARLLEKYSQEQKEAGMQITGKSFVREANLLNAFLGNLGTILKKYTEDGAIEDVFGNEYLGIEKYSHVELAFTEGYRRISFIRLLANGGSQDRYTVLSLENDTFEPTTLNIISDIKNITARIRESFSSITSPSLSCGEGSKRTAIASISSVASWSDFAKEYFYPDAEIIPTRVPLLPSDMKNISKRYDNNSIKTLQELEQEDRELASARFKLNVSKIRSEGFELNNAGSEILANPDKIKTEIQGVVGDPVAILNRCYSELFDKFNLSCLVKSAAECIIPPLGCKDILRGLRVDSLQERIAIAFPGQPQVVDLVNAEIQKLREQNKDAELTIDNVLDAIEKFIDLEAICDIASFISTGAEIPTVDLPDDLPIVDLYASVSFELENAILESLVESIKTMITGIMDDLTSCGTLDSFISSALQGQYGPNTSDKDLTALFTSGALADSLGRRWENFSNRSGRMLENISSTRLTSGASFAGGSATIGSEIDVLGGVSGLAAALKDGNLDKTSAKVLLESMLRADFDIAELINFRGDGSDSLNQILEEIGRFELSDDGTRFTIERVSDDQIITVVDNSSTLPSFTAGSEALSNALSSMIEDITSLLSPGEMLELLAGTPTKRVSDLAREVTRVRHPELNDLGDPANLVAILGETTGLDRLKDQVIILAGDSGQREIPRKYCPEDDDRIALRGEILINGGLSPEEAKAKLDDIIDIRKDRFNDLGAILASGGDFTPGEIIESIRCGTGKQSDGTRPAIIEDQIEATVSVMFDPIKMSFDREIPKLVDAISSFRKKTKKIARTISADSDFPVFNDSNGSDPFGSFTDFLGGLSDFNPSAKKKVNPEFRRLINDGFVPLKEDGSEDGTEAGDGAVTPSFPYTDGEPIEVEDVVRETAGLFKSGIKIEQKDVKITDRDGKFSLDIIGNLKTASPVDDYISVKTPPPRWLMNYAEEDKRYTLRIKSSGNIPSKLYGSVPFFENYNFTKDFISSLEPELMGRLEELTDSSTLPTRKEVFSSLLLDKMKVALDARSEQQLQLFKDAFGKEYDTFIKDFLYDASSSFAKNRLLKKIPNKSLKNLGAEMNVSAQGEASQLIVLNLVSFSPTPTDEQAACNADPHLLDLEFIKGLVKEQFDKECEEGSSFDGATPTRKPINAAGFTGVVLTLIRLYVVEYVFRSLFVLDDFGYSESFAEDELLVDYISFRIREDIGRLGFWGAFEEELLLAYNNLLADNSLQLPSIALKEDTSTALIDTQGSSSDSSLESKTRATVIKSLPEELKNLTKVILKSVLKKMSTLVGSKVDSDIKLERSFIESLDIVESYSNFSESDSFNSTDLTSNNQRFLGKDFTKGRFILERYIRVPSSRDIELKRLQSSPFLNNVVSLNNWEEFISSVIKEPSLAGLKKSDTFGAWKFGLRLVYISAEFGSEVTDISVNNPYYRKMNFNGELRELNAELIEREKSFYFTEKVLNNLPPEPVIATEEEGNKYKQFNSFIIAQAETEVKDVGRLREVDNEIINMYEAKYEQQLLTEIAGDVDYKLLMKHSLLVERLASLMAIHSTFAVNGEEMKFLFEGTKLEMRKLFETMKNLGNYTFRSDLAATKNATEYQAQFNRIGSPAGPAGPDALYLASITPILIFKGIAELLDPNVAISSKIITAAAAGYFAPKVEKASGQIRIEGSSSELNFSEEAIATTNIFTQDATTGELLVKSEAVEETTEETLGQDGTVTVSTKRKVKEDLLPGAPITSFTKVMEVELDASGAPVLDANNQPIIKTNERGDIIIKSGIGKKGIRVPGGEPSALDFSAAASSALEKVTFGTLGLGDLNPEFDIVDSVPVYPGESINLPFNIVSPALLPINVFGLSVPYFLCGPPINYSLGAMQMMYLEPLLYQMPYFQSIYAKSDVSEEIKREYNINLSGKEKFVCQDDKKKSGG